MTYLTGRPNSRRISILWYRSNRTIILLSTAIILIGVALLGAASHDPERMLDLKYFRWLDVDCWLKHCYSKDKSNEVSFDLSRMEPIAVAPNGIVAGAQGANIVWTQGPYLQDLLPYREILELDSKHAVSALAVDSTGNVVAGYQNGEVWSWRQQRVNPKWLMQTAQSFAVAAVSVRPSELEIPSQTDIRVAVADSSGKVYLYDLYKPLHVEPEIIWLAAAEVSALAMESDGSILIGYATGQIIRRTADHELLIYGPDPGVGDWVTEHGFTISTLNSDSKGYSTVGVVQSNSVDPLWNAFEGAGGPPSSRPQLGSVTALASGPHRTIVVGYSTGTIVHWSGLAELGAEYAAHDATVLALSDMDEQLGNSNGSYQSVGRDGRFVTWVRQSVLPGWIWVAAILFLTAVSTCGLILYRRWRNAVKRKGKKSEDAHLEPGAPIREPDAATSGLVRCASQLERFLMNPNSQGSFTIAITGSWGSGKSSLMHLVEGKLKRENYPCVWFNAWHHRTETDLFASLMETIRHFRTSDEGSMGDVYHIVLRVLRAFRFRIRLAMLRLQRRSGGALTYICLLALVLSLVLWLPVIAAQLDANIQDVTSSLAGVSALSTLVLSISRVSPFRLFGASDRSFLQILFGLVGVSSVFV